MKEKEKNKEYSCLQNIVYAFKNIWIWNKKLVVSTVLRIPYSLTISLLSAWIPKVLIDTITGTVDIYSFFRTVILLFVFEGLVNIGGNFLNAQKSISEYKMTSHYETEIYKKLLRIDYEYIENPQTQGIITRSIQAVESNTTSAMQLPNTFATLCINILSFVIFGGIISYLNPWLALLLTFTALIHYLLLKWLRDYNHKMKDKNAKLGRKLGYMNGLSGNYQMGKDIRLYNMAGWLNEQTKQLIDETIKLHGGYRMRSFLVSLINSLIIFLRDGAAYIYLIIMSVNGSISVGDFLLYFYAIRQFAGFINGITDLWSSIQNASMEFNDYRRFENIKNRTIKGEKAKVNLSEALDIDIQNLTYQYPESDEPTLKNINLHISAGEKIAIVGLNGAGKTTLIKLICGMYHPTAGSIKINGHEMDEYDRSDYYSMLSAVFQFFRFLPISIAENIAPNGKEIDMDKVERCAELSGFSGTLKKLPDGLQTLLIRNINSGGIDLSGGEAQKLMLARALYKDAPILVLDEPTSALDPVAESELYRKYNSLTKNKTSIFISHRLASTQFCDRIILLDDGQIIETGTHDELIKAGGKYAELFDVQRQYYKESYGSI